MNTRNWNSPMKRGGLILCLVLLLCGFAQPAKAQTRLIVRDSLGLSGLNLTCLLLGCNVVGGLGDPNGQLFLVVFPRLLDPVLGILKLQLQLGIVDVEIDQIVRTSAAYAGPAPPYLSDTKLVSYYGASVWHGYIAQTPNQLVRTASTQSAFATTGQGVIVAVVDTGVDPNNPILQPLLVSGYDFTRNVSGGSEMRDVSIATNSLPRAAALVNQSTVALLDQSTVALLDGTQYAAFGHGTMTAGIVHLVAPQAKIMPLKSFKSDGTAYNSDILRATYYAVKNGAKVINMSFSYTSSSVELGKAVSYASSKGVIAVASAGNNSQKTTNVYPGSLPSVIDVASTNNKDIQSNFTNYGAPPVWIAAPGEAVMTLYPWGTYAAGWGTSFSAPFVAGAAALMLGTNGGCTSSKIAPGLSHADWISDPDLGYGRLDTYLAVQSCH